METVTLAKEMGQERMSVVSQGRPKKMGSGEDGFVHA